MIYLLVDTCVLSDIMRQYNPLSQYSERISPLQRKVLTH